MLLPGEIYFFDIYSEMETIFFSSSLVFILSFEKKGLIFISQYSKVIDFNDSLFLAVDPGLWLSFIIMEKKLGVSESDLMVFGGSNILGDRYKIGYENYKVFKNIVNSMSKNVIIEDIGGNFSRKIYFKNGKIKVINTIGEVREYVL